jgi:hypothetical protein
MSRSSKKGPWVEERLMKRIEALNAENRKQMIRTWSRASTIFPDMVGHTIAVHDGNRHFQRDQRDQERQRRRKNLAGDDLPMSKAEQARRGDIIVARHHQHFSAQHAAEPGPVDQNDSENDFA